MPISIEEAKAFIEDATKAKRDWQLLADKSWGEINKRQKNHRLWSVTPNSLRRRARYPAWYSIFKIRQPLVLSRIGIPIGRDTTQDGSDTVGATAAMCKERLAKSLASAFDFFDVMCGVRDDGLITNFSTCRAYYERDEVKQNVKEYITPEQTETGIIFIDAEGKEVQSDEISQDDEGYFLEHDEVVDVENEKICLENVLYKNIYVDPGIKKWKRCKRLAFEENYSVPEFKEIFGSAAYSDLPEPDDQKVGADEATPKNQAIKVFEYWDFYEKEVYWWAENGSKFITPKGYLTPNNEEMDDPRNGLYDLERFFPVPDPFIMNAPTSEFWPVPEYYQLVEIFEDIHTIFSRMVAMTKAIRSRLLFDNNVEGLQEALNEAAAGDAIGVTNLSASLAAAGGTLEGVVQYIPVAQLIEGLSQLYTALEQRLNIVYKLTGTSDLLQGLITDQTQRTFGERQMTEKYALNQLAEPQRKMAQFVCDAYELMTEMAIKNFKDASLDMYIMPQTLPPEHQQRYKSAMGMLKEDFKRFRIELETDSTIALNEEFDKQMRAEFVNAITSSIEKTASIAESSPELVQIDLHAMKFLIQGFRQAKMFQSEITESIDNVIKASQERAKNAKPPFDKDQAMFGLEQQRLQTDNQLALAKLTSDERIEMAKLNLDSQIAQIKNSVDQFRLQLEQGEKQADLQLEYQKLNASIGEAQAKIANDRDALMVEMRKVATDQQLAQFQTMVEQQTKPYELQLEAQKQAIDKMELALRQRDQELKMQEQLMIDNHVQSERQLEAMRLEIEKGSLLLEANKPQPPPDVHIHMPQPTTIKKKIKVERDEFGNITNLDSQDIQEPAL